MLNLVCPSLRDFANASEQSRGNPPTKQNANAVIASLDKVKAWQSILYLLLAFAIF